jgi:hypothetical protein
LLLLLPLLLLLLQSVPSTMSGTVMALDMSLASGLRTVSPLIGTQLVQGQGFQGVCLAAAAVLLASFGAAAYLQKDGQVKEAAAEADAAGGTGAEGVGWKKE